MAFEDWFEIAALELLDGDSPVSEAALRTKGTNVNRFCSAIAAAAEQVEFEFDREVSGLYLDTSEGDRLSRLVASDKDVPRHGESAAVVDLLFSRTATAETEVDAGSVFASANGMRFELDTPVSWPLNDTTDKVGRATCTTTGTAGNVPAGSITLIESALDDLTISVTNPEPSTGGAPEESDAAYKERVREFVARQRRGTLPAVVLGALDVPEVRTADAFETTDEAGMLIGGVSVIVGDQGGRANTAIIERVNDELRDWRPAGVFVAVQGATVVEIGIEVQATWSPGQATAANVGALRAAIAARVNNLVPRAAPLAGDADIRCKFRAALVHEAARTVPGCLGVEVLVPAGTVLPDVGEVLRTRPALVVVS